MFAKKYVVVFVWLFGWATVGIAQEANDPSNFSEVNSIDDPLSFADEISRLRAENSALKNEVDALKQKSSGLTSIVERLRELLTNNSFSHQSLLGRLLDSENTSLQAVAIEHLLDSSKMNGTLKLDYKTLVKMVDLLDSAPAKVCKNTIKCLIAYDPVFARERGFQWHGWLPLAEDENIDNTRQKLAQEGEFDSVDEPLDEFLLDVFDSIRSESGFNSEQFGSGHDDSLVADRLVNFSGKDVTLHLALGKVLASCELAFRIQKDHLVVLPIDHQDARTTLTYNVRGLLAKELDIQGAANLCEDLFLNSKRAPTVTVLDEHQLMMSGLEVQHAQLSALLHSIARHKH